MIERVKEENRLMSKLTPQVPSDQEIQAEPREKIVLTPAELLERDSFEVRKHKIVEARQSKLAGQKSE